MIKYLYFPLPYSVKRSAVFMCAVFLFFSVLPLTTFANHTVEHTITTLRAEMLALQAQIESIQATCNKIAPESVSQALALDAPLISAASLVNTTQELIKKQREFQKTGTAASLLELRTLARARKVELVRIMRENPDLAISSLLPRDAAGVVASMTSNCVEEISEAEGTLEIAHADYFDQGTSEEYYSLVLPTKERIALHFAKGFSEPLESGMNIKIRGLKVDSDMVFDGTAPLSVQNPAGGIEVVARPGNPPVLGDQKVLMVLFEFADRGNGMDINNARNAVFGATNDYYKETSFGLVSLSGDAKGTVRIPINQTCQINAVQSEIIKILDPTVDFTQYSRMIMMGPFSCGWSGVAFIGKISVNTADGVVQMSLIGQNTYNAFVTAHELGHGFGNGHASFYQCSDQSIKVSGCSRVEYGDRYDTLGNAAMGHYNAPHKEYTGWLTKGSTILEVLANGRFTLEPIETATGGLKALKIPRGPNDYLYVEYRQPIGFDSGIGGSSDVFQGGLVHIDRGNASYPLLIDTSPPGNAYTPALLPGRTIVDPASGNSVTVVSASPTALVVDVRLVRTDFQPPTMTVTSPVPMSAVFGVVRFAANATDPSGVGRVEFSYRTPNTDWTLIAADTVPPYETNWDSSVVDDGFVYLKVAAYDTLGNLSEDAMAVTVKNGIDNMPPTVSVTSPKSGATVSGTISVSALANDNVEVIGVQFLLDSTNLGAEVTEGLQGSVSGGKTYSLSWNTGQTLNGAHSLSAIARDAKNNKTTSVPVTVTVSNIGPPPPPPPSDITPPSVPTGLTATAISSTQINLSWTASTDNVGVGGYKVFRSTGIIGTFIQIATVNGTTYQNTGLSPNTTYSYTVSAYDAAGNVSSQSSPKSAITPPPSDTTPPTATLTSPLAGATVSGMITVSANASDNVGVVGVQFKLDGTNLGAEDTVSPYSTSWNTALAINGSHTLTAVARDAAGNTRTSPAITVTVSNIGPPPPPPPVPQNAFLGQYYDNMNLTNLKVTRTDAAINFNWSNGSPDPLIGSDTFSVRWEGDWNFATAGTYRFTAQTDDGLRIWIDGVSILDKWINQPPTIYTIDQNLTQGIHRVKVEYYENGVGATAILNWLLVTPPPPPTPPTDTTPPTVAITSPQVGTAISKTITVSGTITVSANASDNIGVVEVQFKLDGTNLGAEDTVSPYSTSWNTTTAINGSHTLTAVARDQAGNTGTSPAVAVTVSNTPGIASPATFTTTSALYLKLKAIQVKLNRITEIIKNFKP